MNVFLQEELNQLFGGPTIAIGELTPQGGIYRTFLNQRFESMLTPLELYHQYYAKPGCRKLLCCYIPEFSRLGIRGRYGFLDSLFLRHWELGRKRYFVLCFQDTEHTLKQEVILLSNQPGVVNDIAANLREASQLSGDPSLLKQRVAIYRIYLPNEFTRLLRLWSGSNDCRPPVLPD